MKAAAVVAAVEEAVMTRRLLVRSANRAAEEDAKGEKAEEKKKALEKEHLKKGTIGGRKRDGAGGDIDSEEGAELQGVGGHREHNRWHYLVKCML